METGNARGTRFCKSPQIAGLSLLLLAQIAVFYSHSLGSENVPVNAPLEAFHIRIGEWERVQDGVMEQRVLDALKADDVLNRIYARPGDGLAVGLFVAYFRTQRTGQSPHSPKNCLPGSGWMPVSSAIVPVDIPGSAPIEVNRYVVARGDQRTLTYYWYQSHGRVVASEYAAKVYLVADAFQRRRTDTALVRVVVPIEGRDPETADRAARDFIGQLYPKLTAYLPM